MPGRLTLWAVLACALCVVVVRGQQAAIFQDYSTGFSTVLPNPTSSSVQDMHSYDGSHSGSFRFGVSWNGDASDVVNFTWPFPVQLLAENNATFCALNPSTTPPNLLNFTAASPHQCNYTVAWNQSFSGAMTLTYTGGPTGFIRTDSISVFFTSASSVVGDPQFVGLRGQSYQVHGIDGAVYNLITQPRTQVNARFTFLTAGRCPIIDGTPDIDCWSHPGSYLGQMSFQQLVGGRLHTALVTAGAAHTGFAGVEVDGRALAVGEEAGSGAFVVSLTSTHRLRVRTEHFDVELRNSDRFLNQALRATVPLSQLSAHGLLGQTHSTKVHSSPLRYVEGEVDDYAIADGDIFGDTFLYNQFQR